VIARVSDKSGISTYYLVGFYRGLPSLFFSCLFLSGTGTGTGTGTATYRSQVYCG
jgi:hypothetical protein